MKNTQGKSASGNCNKKKPLSTLTPPCQFKMLLNLPHVIFVPTPFGLLPSLTLTPYFLWEYYY
jgi:hypothetical protein